MTRARTQSPAVALFAATLVAMLSGCSFNWGEGGIGDIMFGGRPAGNIVASASNADSEEAKEAKRKAEEDYEERSNLRRVAILPVAYTDGAKGISCDICPADVALKPTSAKAARLATGFIYEAVARHPRLLFPPPEAVEKAATGRGMREAAALLASNNKTELVIAAALIELRPRVGSDDSPEKPAGVALYAALIEAATGKVLWSDTFDEDESGRNFALKGYDTVMNDKPVRYHTAEGFSEVAVDELIEDLVDEID